jgi:predicted GTPase
MNNENPVKKALTNPVLFIGFTGAGKSTTVNCLAGASMVQVNRRDGTIRYDVAPGGRLDLAAIGHIEIHSETLFAKDVFPTDEPSMRFVDCPGFGDSRGFEFDCAHAGDYSG